MKREPYSFDQPAYDLCFRDPAEAMDKRHIYIVHQILASWPFVSALELGSWLGASATAFVEAINGGAKMMASFCDVQVTEGLQKVTANSRRQVGIFKCPSWELLANSRPFDFILVDAYHDIESVSHEVAELIKRKPLCIMAHDTNATAAGYPKAEGAKFLADVFRAHPEYHGMEDCVYRDGERTERGLFFATTDPALMKIAKDVFRFYASQPTTDEMDATEAAKRLADPKEVPTYFRNSLSNPPLVGRGADGTTIHVSR